MAPRRNFGRRTNIFSSIFSRIEHRIKSIIQPLINDRNELKKELAQIRFRLVDMEKKYWQATIEILEVQLRGVQHVCLRSQLCMEDILNLNQRIINYK